MEKSLAKRIANYACVGDDEVRRLRRKIDALEKSMIHAYHNSRNYAQLREMYCTRKAPYWIYAEECYFCAKVAIVHGEQEHDAPQLFECMLPSSVDCNTIVCADCIVNADWVSCVECKDTFCEMCYPVHECIQE